MVAGFSDFGGEAFLVGISDFVAEAFFAGISDFAGGAFFVSSLCFESPGSTLDFKLCKSSCRLRLFRTLLLVFCLRWLVVSFTYLARSRLGWHACDIEFSTHEACSWDSRWRIRPNILHGFVKTLNRCRAKMNRSILSHLAFAFILGGTLSFRLLLSGTA